MTHQFTPYVPTPEEREADARTDAWKKERARKAAMEIMERRKQERFNEAMREFIASRG